jgi:hypothetical protein
MNKKQKFVFIDFIESIPGEVILYSLELSKNDTKFHTSVYTILKYSPEHLCNRLLEEMADAASWEEGKLNGLMMLVEVGINRLQDSPKDVLLSKLMLIAKNEYGYLNFAKVLHQEFNIPSEIIDKTYIEWFCTINNKMIETISQDRFEECVKDFCVVISIDLRLKLKRVLMSFCRWPLPQLNKMTQVFMESDILGSSG